MIRAARFLLPCLVAGVLGAQVHGVRTADLDPATPPCGDFFQYANGGWMRANPVPPDRTSWGAFDEMEARAGAVLREVLEDAAASGAPGGSVPRQVGDFFASGMDTASVVRAGLAPLREGLARIDGVGDLAGLGRELARLHLAGARAGFALTVGPDERRRTVHIAQVAQGGLGMPDREDYLAEGSRELRAAYLDYLARLFTLAGETPGLARAHAGIAFDMERRLAGVSMTRAQLRDPVATYHRLSQEDLSALAPRFPWRAYFEAAGLGAREELLVRQPAFMAGLSALAADTPAPQWRAYLKARLLDASAPFLGGAFEDASLAFHEGGRQPRWRRVARATEAALGGALGRMYVARTFSPRSRARAQDLAARVRAALEERIRNLPGLNPPAREAALGRLDALTVKVGYPDEWQDAPALKVDRAGYLGNVQRAAGLAFRSQLALLGRPVDGSRWSASPAAVTACYDPRLNELVLPALEGLEAPAAEPLDPKVLAAGSMTALIAHIESTHHVFTREELNRVAPLMEKVARVHGANHPELVQVARLFTALFDDLMPHLEKEEQILFPFIRGLEADAPACDSCFGSVRGPISVMQSEHEAAGDVLREIRELTKDYTLPDDACGSFRSLYMGLQNLEEDLHLHIYLESHILFPRAAEMETAKA